MVNKKMTNKKMVSLWVVCLAIILVAINMRTPIVVLGSIAPLLEQDLNITQVEIGWLGAIPMFMFAFGALVSARFSKWVGIHNLLPIMIILLSVGTVFRVVVVNWWVFFAGTVVLSLAIGFLNAITMPAIKKLAPQNIPLTTGLFSLVLTIFAGLAAGFVLPISEFLGWRWATAGWVVASGFALVVWWGLRSHLQQINASQLATKNNAQSGNISAAQTNTHINMWQNPMAWSLAIFLGIQSLMYYLVASFLPSIWVSKGLTLITAGQMAMLFQFMAPVAIVLLTLLMSRKDYARSISVIASVLIVLGSMGITFGSFEVRPLFWASVWTVCIGFGASLVFTLSLMLINLRTYDMTQAADLSGMAQAVGYTIAIAGPLGAGWLHNLSNSWDLPLMVLTGLMVVNTWFAWQASASKMIDGKPFNH